MSYLQLGAMWKIIYNYDILIFKTKEISLSISFQEDDIDKGISLCKNYKDRDISLAKN